MTAQITEVHTRSGGLYSAPRVHAALLRDGHSCGRRRVARLMRGHRSHRLAPQARTTDHHPRPSRTNPT
ncbi:IS3 family transposase [Streptomyces sp. NPDC002054]|uniref:IS3 family transposase n=1 Tax=Streptomyces sp. NPDC002054 TaxID=3154663 RepID=UPI003331DB21